MVDIPFDTIAGISPAEVGEVELYHPKSWWTRYVFSQDAKVIAIQYSITAMSIGMVALVLSWLMRLQLGFPGTFSFIDPNQYLQLITMHGMIMVIYLLTVSGRFRKLQMLPERLHVGFGFPFDEQDRRASDRALAWIRRVYPTLPTRLRTVGPYQEAQARLRGEPQLDWATRWLNRVWIGRPMMDGCSNDCTASRARSVP